MKKLIVLISSILLISNVTTATLPTIDTGRVLVPIPLGDLRAVAKSNEIGKTAQKEVILSRKAIDSLQSLLAQAKIIFAKDSSRIALLTEINRLDSLLIITKEQQLDAKEKENALHKSYIATADKKTKKARRTTVFVIVLAAIIEAATIYILAK